MKLSLDALKERAEATASNELLATITGGIDNACHDAAPTPTPTTPTLSAPPSGGTWEGYLNGKIGADGKWEIGTGIKYTWPNKK